MNIPSEYEWMPFDQTSEYKDYLKRRGHNDQNSNQHKGFSMMILKLHNQMNLNYNKVLSKIKFFSEKGFSKFPNSKKWKLKFGVKNVDHNHDEVECTVSVIRPDGKNLFVKKESSNLDQALNACIRTLQNNLAKASKRIKRKKSDIHFENELPEQMEA